MEGRKLRDLLLLKPAISVRNLTSLGLVFLFFGVYVASGGKVTTTPSVKPGGGFGGLEESSQPINVRGDVLPRAVETAPRNNTPSRETVQPPRLFDQPQQPSRKAAKEFPSRKGEVNADEDDGNADDLSEIERRLKLR